MNDMQDLKFVAAIEGADGKARFLDDLVPLPAGPNTKSVLLWRFEGDGSIPSAVGGVPPDSKFTGPGGATYIVVHFPAHFMGVTAEELQQMNPSVQLDHGDDPEMHTTNSIDMGFMISGKADLKLPGGQIRTLQAGQAFVMAGARHSWANPYDEPCIFTNVIVGVRREA